MMQLGVQRQLKRRSRNFSLIVIFALVVVNVFLYIGLYRTPCRELHSFHAEKLQFDNSSAQAASIFQYRPGRWDKKRQYQMLDSFVVGANYLELSRKSRVTLATQTDPSHFHHIYEVAMQWSGPISVALFAAGIEDRLVLEAQIGFLFRCHKNIADKISFHLLLPETFQKGGWNLVKLASSLVELRDGLDCEMNGDTFGTFVDLWESVKDTRKIALMYPQNHLRNLARKNSQTSHVFLTDVDIVPCFDFRERLEAFLAKELESDSDLNEGKKIAYVVPTYEIDEKAPFPKSKGEIVDLAKRGLARPFYKMVFPLNQWSSNLRKWQNTEDPDDDFRVAYNVTQFYFGYEPFYIAQDNAPPHDERFIGYGFTRNTQVFEMAVAGYTFSVLSPAFGVHRGFKKASSCPPWRMIEINQNRKKMPAFEAELIARYNVSVDDIEVMRFDPKNSSQLVW